MARILVDTSAVYAILDHGDRCHTAAREALQGLRHSRLEPLLNGPLGGYCGGERPVDAMTVGLSARSPSQVHAL
jgi:hypothetical protein